MQIGPWQILIVAIVVLALFGRGKISGMMGEFGKGITAFKKGVKDSTAELDSEQASAARDVTAEPVVIPVVTERDKV